MKYIESQVNRLHINFNLKGEIMRNLLIGLIILSILSVGSAFGEGFTLESNDISGQLSKLHAFNYPAFGCNGDNVSPHLRWRNIPSGTKSFAIMVHDPDAPTGGGGWYHWVVFNIPSNITSFAQDSGNIKKNLLPESAVQSVSDYGQPGYGGACPPKGDKPHRYIFTVYALDIAKAQMGSEMVLTSKSSPAMVGCLINDHTLAKASLIAYYSN